MGKRSCRLWLISRQLRSFRMRNHVVKLFLLCALGTLSWAQFDVGSVGGNVKDPSGLPVAGATVELRSQTTNVVRDAKTSEDGRFDFLSLHPDTYSLSTKHEGFRERSQTFTLAVGQRTDLDVSLDI